MPNPVVHFEILGRDAKQLQDFYQQAFGWSIDANNPMNYGVTDTGGGGINGGIAGAEDGNPTAMFYIEVADPAAALEQVKALGGKVVMDVTVIPDMVTFAQFTDPDGNRIGLVKSEDGA